MVSNSTTGTRRGKLRSEPFSIRKGQYRSVPAPLRKKMLAPFFAMLLCYLHLARRRFALFFRKAPVDGGASSSRKNTCVFFVALIGGGGWFRRIAADRRILTRRIGNVA